jgi:hypothetical protein
LATRLQPPPAPHRHRRPPTHQPLDQPPRSVHLARPPFTSERAQPGRHEPDCHRPGQAGGPDSLRCSSPRLPRHRAVGGGEAAGMATLLMAGLHGVGNRGDAAPKLRPTRSFASISAASRTFGLTRARGRCRRRRAEGLTAPCGSAHRTCRRRVTLLVAVPVPARAATVADGQAGARARGANMFV